MAGAPLANPEGSLKVLRNVTTSRTETTPSEEAIKNQEHVLGGVDDAGNLDGKSSTSVSTLPAAIKRLFLASA